jgi:hypothetical protein
MLQLQRKHFQRVRKKQEATLLRQGTECLPHEYSAAGYGGRGVILSVMVSVMSADFVIFSIFDLALCDVFLERGDRVVLPAAECRVVARIQNS